jgi:hypothetical protein
VFCTSAAPGLVAQQLRGYTSTPYSGSVIAEIVSVSAYESQVSALLTEEERMAMEFHIACAPEVPQ